MWLSIRYLYNRLWSKIKYKKIIIHRVDNKVLFIIVQIGEKNYIFARVNILCSENIYVSANKQKNLKKNEYKNGDKNN